MDGLQGRCNAGETVPDSRAVDTSVVFYWSCDVGILVELQVEIKLLGPFGFYAVKRESSVTFL
ncbi:hypothetical protein AYO44_16525 [Planctomycetaceae bacterium SCGC AG-212-F19]|nr:hypothetical protein AYO44_16525 [Planctomycetaceae bacterium SCGC AG-212-F19]